MKLNKKKGFTIVELVIVIAVIAILAAVLIPTFVRLVRKSKINNDIQIVKELNLALASDAVENEHNTMTDALIAANSFGIDLTKWNVKASGNDIYWDSQNDVFCYLNDGTIEYIPESVEESKRLNQDSDKLWKIVTKAMTQEELTATKTSIYFGSPEAAASLNGKTVSR